MTIRANVQRVPVWGRVLHLLVVFGVAGFLLVGLPQAGWSTPLIQQANTSNLAYQPLILSGDPAGVPADSPANRVDPNTTTSPFAGVGSIIINPPGPDQFFCSGVAISDRHILTAGHCLDFNDDGVVDALPGEVTFFLNFGGDLTHQITASALDIHPDFSGFNNPALNDDLGIITLDTPLPAGVPIYPIFADPFQFVELIVMVGYGVSGDGVTGFLPGSSNRRTKRVGANLAEAAIPDDEGSGLNEVFLFDFDGPDGTTNLFGSLTLGNDIETTTAPGDSGGPSFVVVNGKLALFGINTFGANTSIAAHPLFGSVAGGVVVSPYTDWITDDLGIDAKLVSAIPEPGTFILTSVGLFSVLFYYWQQRRKFAR